jgi:hypothetical protein
MKILIEAARNVLFTEDSTETKILRGVTNPDKISFDHTSIKWDRSDFTFLYVDGVLVYSKTKIGEGAYNTHDNILGLMEYFVQGKKPQFNLTRDRYDAVKFSKNPSDATLKKLMHYYIRNNLDRKATRAGRSWTNVHSTLNKDVTVIAFWCNESDIDKAYLNMLASNFKYKTFMWCAMDSKYYNEYTHGHSGNAPKAGNTSKLSSKKYPKLTHEEIVNILMKAHTSAAHKLSAMERGVIDEFKGLSNIDSMIKTTGGYATAAEYNYYSRMSEETDI